MKTKQYITIDLELLSSYGFFSKKTGEAVKLLPNDKILYSYMKSKINHFVQERGGEFFATQEQLAEALCADRTSVRKSLTKFMDGGIIVAEKKLFKNYWNWRYKSISNLDLFVRGENGDPVPVNSILPEEDTDGVPF